MKKEKIIIIKNPRLKKVRGNLRKILLQTISSKIDQLEELEELIIEERGLRNKKRIELRDEIDKLFSLRGGSICRCGNGGSCLSLKKFRKEHPMNRMDFTDLDMAYIPEQGEWFCVECYKRIKFLMAKYPVR